MKHQTWKRLKNFLLSSALKKGKKYFKNMDMEGNKMTFCFSGIPVEQVCITPSAAPAEVWSFLSEIFPVMGAVSLLALLAALLWNYRKNKGCTALNKPERQLGTHCT